MHDATGFYTGDVSHLLLDLVPASECLRAAHAGASSQYLIDGLLPEGGLSLLGAKPKAGKSSLARHIAVCAAKGRPCLGRDTMRGESIIFSLEDPKDHVGRCLEALNYDFEQDALISVVKSTKPSVEETITALRNSLAALPNVRLVVVDVLTKLLRFHDVADYSPVQRQVEQLRDVARDHGKVHILAVVHSKKAVTVDPFDSFLGSSALRGEADTNLVLYEGSGRKLIAAETRIGRPLQPSILEADTRVIRGAEVVCDFRLGDLLEDAQAEETEQAQQRRAARFDREIVDALARQGGTAPKEDTLKVVPGRKQAKLEAVRKLVEDGVITQSDSSPKTLTLALEGDALKLYLLKVAQTQ